MSQNCSGCGVPLKPNSKFCFGCGQKVAQPGAAPAAAPAAPASPATSPAPLVKQPSAVARDPLAPPNLVQNRNIANKEKALETARKMDNMIQSSATNRACGTCGKTVYDAEEVKFRHLVFHKGGCFICHYAECEVRTLTLGKAIESMGKVYCSNTCASNDQNLEIIGGGGPKPKPKVLDEGPPCAECSKPCGAQFVKLGGKNYHKACIGDRLPKCARCGDPATGRILKLEELRYHAECFTCCNCQTQLSTYVMLGDSLYCEPCADKAPPTASEIKEQAGGKPSALTKRSTKRALKSTKAPNEALTLPMPAPGTQMVDGSHKEGYLKKKGGKMGVLAIPKERYFVVLDKKIEYYEADAKGGLMCRTGGMPLFHCCVVQPNEQDRRKFVITPNTAEAAKTYQLEAPTAEEAAQWMKVISDRIAQAPKREGRGIPAPAVGEKMMDSSIKEGFLRKKGGTLKNWSTRYFVLSPKKLEYYEFDKETKLMYKTGELTFNPHSIVEIDVKDIKNFFVNSHESVTSKLYELGALHPQDAEDWMQAIKSQFK